MFGVNQSLDSYNDQFGVDGVAQVVAGNGDLPAVVVRSPVAQGTIYLHGGQVSSWIPASAGTDVLFVSRQAIWRPDRAIRGGIPVCFPWFGAHPANPSASANAASAVTAALFAFFIICRPPSVSAPVFMSIT